MIIDSQVHLWPANTAEHPWPSDRKPPASGQTEFLPHQLISAMDVVGVDAAVIVPPIWAGDDNSIPLRWSGEYPGRLGVMGRLDLWAADAPARLRRLTIEPNFLGLRLSFPAARGLTWLDLDQFDWFWALAEELRLPVMVLLQGEQVAKAEPVVMRHPELTLIVDHMGLVIGHPIAEDPFIGLPQLVDLSRFPNVSVKLSALPEYTLEEFPYPSLSDKVRQVYDAYGARRLMWGSDLTRLSRSDYRQVRDHVRSHLDFLTGADKEWIFGRTAASLLHWHESEFIGATA